MPQLPSRALLALALAVGLSSAACAYGSAGAEEPDDGAASEDVSSTSSAMIAAPGSGGDCSDALGACYRACQAQAPSPETACFSRCDGAFSACLQ